MIYHFIMNPKSGRCHKDQKLEDIIKTACKTRQLKYHIYYTTCSGDATEYVSSMVRIAQGEPQRFICIGGDGSISEIVNSAPSNPLVEFGVIPRGSGNDFVRNFSGRKLFADIEAQLDGEAIPLDLIRCNEYYSANMINIGFDCAVVRETEKLKKHKWIPRSLLYILGVFIVFFRKAGTKMKLTFPDGEVIEKELMLTAIGNGRFCGGGFNANPRALLNDGLLDICAIDKISKPTFISLVSSYKKGTFLSNKRAQKVISYKQFPSLKMEFEEPIPICIDGEIKGAKSLDLEIVRNAFNFVVPKGCKALNVLSDEKKMLEKQTL